MLAVYDTNEPDRDTTYDMTVIELFYNPNVRKVDFIRTYSPDYE